MEAREGGALEDDGGEPGARAGDRRRGPRGAAAEDDRVVDVGAHGGRSWGRADAAGASLVGRRRGVNRGCLAPLPWRAGCGMVARPWRPTRSATSTAATRPCSGC